MPALLALVHPPTSSGNETNVRALRTLVGLEGGELACWHDPADSVLLAARCCAWESDAGLAVAGPVVVAADASLYYRADLATAINAAGGAADPAASPAVLIAAAYGIWGVACFERLEGDYAVAVWDDRRRVVHLARDFGGSRPLFHTVLRAGAIGVASSLEALLELPGADTTLDRDALAESSTWIFRRDSMTVHRAVRRVPAGAVVTLDAATGREVAHVRWEPPVFEQDARAGSFDDAAAQLRELLGAAVTERLARSSGTAVWMSGGYDSTAVFAAGHHAGAHALMPVSVSYPEGDTGREDEAIELVAARWNASVRWLDSTGVDLFAHLAASTGNAEEPFIHLYAEFNAALARTTLASGSRVALGGYGGDQLFWASNVYLADLLRTGHLRSLWREARRSRVGVGGAADWIVRPLLPERVLTGLRRMGGGDRWLRPLERAVPAWIKGDVARGAGLDGAFHRDHPRRRAESLSAYDTYYSLANPFFARVLEAVNGIARAEGVDYRSPLLDARVVRFAATRPRSDRSSGGEQKRLLRAAMRPLLPASILAPRPYKTGTARDLFAMSARRWLPALLEDVGRAPLLGDLGIVDVDAFRRACSAFTSGGDMLMAGALMPTLQTELWLRGQERRAARVRRQQLEVQRQPMRTMRHAASELTCG